MHKYFFIGILLFASNCYAQEEFDPTKPSQAEGSSEEYGDSVNSHGVYLNGIFARKTGYTVILNGKVLHVGDSIEGYKITAITKDSVTLKSNASKTEQNSKDTDNSNLFELKLSNLNFKQPHK